MTEHFTLDTILLDPMIALVNKADGVSQASFAQLVRETAERCGRDNTGSAAGNLRTGKARYQRDTREIRLPQFAHLEENTRLDMHTLVQVSRARRCWVSITDGHADHAMEVESGSSH